MLYEKQGSRVSSICWHSISCHTFETPGEPRMSCIHSLRVRKLRSREVEGFDPARRVSHLQGESNGDTGTRQGVRRLKPRGQGIERLAADAHPVRIMHDIATCDPRVVWDVQILED